MTSIRRRVLVTRPEPGASETAARLDEAGFQPLVLPLTKTAPLAPADIPDLAVFDAVAVTSSSALRHAPPDLLARLAGKRGYAVGPRTAEAFDGTGMTVADTAAGDAESLAALIIASENRGARILHLCGRVRRANFAPLLQQAGIDLTALETYDTVPVDYTLDAVADRVGWNPVWGALVYSAAGAERLVELMERPQLAILFIRTHYFCMSGRIAEVLGKERTLIASEPSEEAIFARMATAP